MPDSLHIANARIWTGDSAQPWATSMTIHDGEIVEMDGGPGRGGNVRIIDGGADNRRVIVPGLIDSHMHLLMGGKSLSEIDLSQVKSRAVFEAAIAEADARLPPGQWLIGRGWSEQNWGSGLPDKSWFGKPGRPCIAHRMDIHAVVVNEVVLKMLDAAKLRDPVGGKIVRDSHGQPTGLFLEAAAWELINPLIPEPDIAAKRAILYAAEKHANALGLTAVGSMEFMKDVREVFAPMRSQLTLRCAITLLDRATGANDSIRIDQLEDVPDDEWLSIRGCKTFIDGTLGSRTARMLEDYADRPGNRGMLVELAAGGANRLKEWIHAVAECDLSPSMHAIGDEAVRLALDAVESLSEEAQVILCPRIEHAQHIHPDDINRFAGGVIASMQPLHKADDGRYIETALGPQRAKQAFPFRSLIDAGAILAFGSDWPVVSCDPMLGMRAAITGLTLDDRPFNTEQNVTVEQALRAYTVDAAYCLQLDRCGILEEGFLGDCVMLDIDPFTADWVRRPPPRAVMTIVGGEVVFDAR